MRFWKGAMDMAVCKACGKQIVVGEEFIVIGKFPKHTRVYMRSISSHRVGPETWGDIYHKSCFGKDLTERKSLP